MTKLLEARDILSQRGLTKDGTLENSSTGCLCALGALNMAYWGCSGEGEDSLDAYWPSDPDQVADLRALAKEVVRRKSWSNELEDCKPIYRYNDDPSTTLEDMLSLFTEAAANLD